MDKPHLINTFDKGVVADFDKQKTANSFSTYSLNGRIVFNRNGTLSWSQAKGNKLAINLGFNYGQSTNYSVIGGFEINGYLILFSTQNTVQNNISGNWLFSEIGFLTEPTKGTYVYQTCFNDQYDPYGQKLHFSTRYQIQPTANFENNSTIKTYWGDDFNEDRAFNILTGATKFTINGINYFAAALAAYLPYIVQPTVGNDGVQGAIAGAKYPYYYSVHGMSELLDVQLGLMKYVKNIPGTKKAGERQYFYRLVHQSGMFTPWSPGSGMIFLTAQEVNATDWTQYGMVASGTPTYKGHQLFIKYIDTRFTYIEVAVAYYPTSGVQPSEAGIFFKGPITLVPEIVGGNPTGAQGMYISDVSDVYIQTLTPAQLIQEYTDVLHSKTRLTNENYYHKANVVVRPNMVIDVSGVTIEPLIRLMGSDQDDAITAPPLTVGANVSGDFVSVELFSGVTEEYVIGDTVSSLQSDYINYKGTQIDCLFKGDFRGQKTPLAIVVFSTKGQPFFAQHIGDYQQPDQFGNQWTNTVLDATGTPITTTGTKGSVGDYTLTNWNPASTAPITNQLNQSDFITPVINILGKLISGIDLTDVLYDQYGEIQISGFSIVRADRVPNLIAQGLVLNVSNIYGTAINSIGIGTAGNYISPLHSSGNTYFDVPAPSPPYLSFINQNIDHGSGGAGNSGTGFQSECIIVGNYFTLDLPDNLINPNVIKQITDSSINGSAAGVNLQLVGNVQAMYVHDTGGVFTQPTQLGDGTQFYTSFYTKNYMTKMFLNAPGDLLIGSDQISSVRNVGISSAVGDFGYKTAVEKIWTPTSYNQDPGRDNTYALPPFGSNNPVTPSTSAGDVDNFQFGCISYLTDFYFNIGRPGGNGTYHAVGPLNQVVVSTPAPGFANASLRSEATFPVNDGINNICYYLANLVTGNEVVLNESIVSGRIYKGIGHFVPINATTIAAATQPGGRVVFNNVEVWGGDCYVDYFDYGRLIPIYDDKNVVNDFFDYGCGLIFPCETVYNHTMRVGNQFSGVSLRPGITESTNTVQPLFYSGLYANFIDSTDARFEDFNLNSVMQASDMVAAYEVPPAYFQNINDIPLLEMYAGPKVAGEIYDSFRQFLPNNQQLAYQDYGAITNIMAMGANIYALQQKGFSRIRFNERQEQATSSENLTVGVALGYSVPGHQVLGGKDFGGQHQWSVWSDKKSIGWINSYAGKAIKFGANGLEAVSDVHGQHFFFLDNSENYWSITNPLLQDANENLYDSPCSIGGVSAGYDYTQSEQPYTFSKIMTDPGNGTTIPPTYTGVPVTMVWNDKMDAYSGNYSYVPNIYFSFKQNMLAPDPLNPQNIYEFNEGDFGQYFGVTYPSQVEFIVKAERQFIFDNNECDVNPEAFGVIENVVGTTVNGSQTIVLNNPALDNRPIYRNSALVFPVMAIGQSTRLRGSYLDLLYTVDNTPNTEVLFTEHRCFIRPDFR